MIIIEDSCDICIYCVFQGIKKYDCYDMELYRCEKTKEIMDEFHIHRKPCCDFHPQDWISV